MFISTYTKHPWCQTCPPEFIMFSSLPKGSWQRVHTIPGSMITQNRKDYQNKLLADPEYILYLNSDTLPITMIKKKKSNDVV